MKKIIVALLFTALMGASVVSGYLPSNSIVSSNLEETLNNSSEVVLSSEEVVEEIIETLDIDICKNNLSFLNFSAELIARVNEDKNILLSPLSIYIALSMLVNGCDNNTKVQIEEMLGLSVDELNEYCYSIISGFDRDNSELSVANSLWVNSDLNINIKKSYLDVSDMYYDTEVNRESFSDENTLGNINQWCSDKTNGMINEILKDLDPNIAMILINALYFEAKWLNKNYHNSTRNFTNYDGNTISAEFFSGVSSSYYYSDKADAVKIALEDDYYFLGILPHEDDIGAYLKTFNGIELYKLTTQSTDTYDVYWRLPNFEYDYDTKLQDTIKAMGMIDAFNPYSADLSKLSDRDLVVSDVIHKSRIELNNGGIKAAAVTAIVGYLTGIWTSPREPKYIYLDRPFVYAIMDSKTNTPIFIGAVKSL